VGQPLPKQTVFFGEISLSGDIRPAPQAELRLKEAAKLGFTTAIVPAGTKAEGVGMELRPVRDMGELLSLAGAEQRSSRRGRLES
jgi:DNA repair protein RadA/Sms